MAGRPIKRLLVVNRGEIAIRVLSAARELGIHTITIYSKEDTAHTTHAHESILIPKPASFVDIPLIISIAKKCSADAVHPAYGFLSENHKFAQQVEVAGIAFVGPSWRVLEATGDKTSARRLAEECSVPVLPAMAHATDNVQEVSAFVKQGGIGLPVMLKAADGGGGRGIRLVNEFNELEDAFRRCCGESPSKKAYAEKAAMNGFRHVEIQIIADLHGNITHLHERECSIQRRYQKVIEIAPSTFLDRNKISKVIDAAVKLAKHIKYSSLGTFEFLVDSNSPAFYFLEINPRLQVEHTVTESLFNVDIVQTQLLIAQGSSLNTLGLYPPPPLPQHLQSMQLRVTAENPKSNFNLSIGRINRFVAPGGNGVRVDTHLASLEHTIVGSDYDSLLAKIIVTARSRPELIRKGLRALQDMIIEGVTTNVSVLRGVILSDDFAAGRCDTRWLESHLPAVISAGESAGESSLSQAAIDTTGAAPVVDTASVRGAGSLLLSKGDAWDIVLTPADATSTTIQQRLQVTRLLRNDFPNSLSADISYTTGPATPPANYKIVMTRSTTSANVSSASLKKGDPRNPLHVIIPFSGELVEVCVDEGDEVLKGEVVAVVKQMKTEMEIRASRDGIVKWVTEAEEGEVVQEGGLLLEFEGKGSKL